MCDKGGAAGSTALAEVSLLARGGVLPLRTVLAQVPEEEEEGDEDAEALVGEEVAGRAEEEEEETEVTSQARVEG
jgi:hypothetical protein